MKRIIIIALILVAHSSLFAQSKYTLPCRAELLTASKDSLIEQIGTTERTGKNDGDVKKYWNLFTKYPIPYCAAGQYWCFYRACLDLKFPLSEIPIYKTALANGIFDNARKVGTKAKYAAAVNDLIIWKKPNSYNGHVERIIEVQKAGWVTTVGFNTGSGDARDGDGVWERRRNLFHILSRMQVRGLVGFVVSTV